MRPPYLRDGSWAHVSEDSHRESKEQAMFPTAHPDFTGQLAADHVATLRAEAERSRLRGSFLTSWRPARIVEPAADLSRVAPVQAPHTDRAA
jgi:hypothetical protein